MSILEDAEGHLTLADARRMPEMFQPASTSGLIRGHGHGALWVRFTLSRPADAPPEWWLQVRPATIDAVLLYSPHGSEYTERRSGDSFPFLSRDFFSRDMTFRLVLPDTVPQTYYLRLAWASAIPASLRLWQEEGWLAQAEWDSLVLGAFFGVLAFNLLLNAMLWLWLRESLYLAYGLYLLSLGALLLCINGLVSLWLFPYSPVLANESTRVATFISLAITAWFYVPLLQLRRTAPKAGWLITGIALFYLACLLVSYFIGFADAARVGQTVRIALHMPLLFIIDLIFLLRPGFRFYILAFLPQQVFSLLFCLTNLGFLDAEFRLDVGILIHMTLLSLSLADRVRCAERDRRRAQDEALFIAREAERILERRVAERSADLLETNAALSREVTERRQLQDQLQNALTVQRQIAAMLSHEFRTPLAIIDTIAQRLSLTAKGAEESGARLEIIRRAVGRMNLLIDNLLAEDRITGLGLESRFEAVDLAEIVKEAVEQCQVLIVPPLVMELRIQAVPLVRGDRALILLATANLLQNAIKYSPEGGKITVRVQAVEAWVELMVIDMGIGIDPDCLPRIFERYFRGRRAVGNGSGLGLYLARQIVLAHGGNIKASSIPGQGSQFAFKLPRTWLGPGHEQSKDTGSAVSAPMAKPVQVVAAAVEAHAEVAERCALDE